MTETADILRRAKARIEDPAHWCRGWFAKDATGDECNAKAKIAVAWCAVGALKAERGGTKATPILEMASQELFHYPAPWVNDGDVFGHSAVLAMYDKAIALAEAEE